MRSSPKHLNKTNFRGKIQIQRPKRRSNFIKNTKISRIKGIRKLNLSMINRIWHKRRPLLSTTIPKMTQTRKSEITMVPETILTRKSEITTALKLSEQFNQKLMFLTDSNVPKSMNLTVKSITTF
jgi:hypothetical protein